MKYLLPALGICITVVLLGYLWPPPQEPAEPVDQEAWVWPNPPPPVVSHSMPSKLNVYWPGTAATIEADPAVASAKQGAAAHSWRLIGIIRQGPDRSAQVLDPKQQIVTLNVGDALDAQRRVTAIEATRLRWQNPAGAVGELLLYPQPAADINAQSAAQPEPEK